MDRLNLQNAEVGDGVTSIHYSDRQAHTIIQRSKTRLWIQRDHAILLNAVKSGEPDALTFTPGGFCGHTSGTQRYNYLPNKEGSVQEFSRRDNGKWVLKGERSHNGLYLVAGRDEYYDFNF